MRPSSRACGCRQTSPWRRPGRSYIPTGVEIEYYYQITDVNGNTVETTPWAFEYRDPRYRWESITIDSLTVLYHGHIEPARRPGGPSRWPRGSRRSSRSSASRMSTV